MVIVFLLVSYVVKLIELWLIVTMQTVVVTFTTSLARRQCRNKICRNV